MRAVTIIVIGVYYLLTTIDMNYIVSIILSILGAFHDHRSTYNIMGKEKSIIGCCLLYIYLLPFRKVANEHGH